MNQKNTLLVLYIVGGGLITLFQRYLTFYFDNFTLNFFRFFSGSITLLVVVIINHRTELKQTLRCRDTLLKIAAYSLLVLVSQYFCIEGLSRTSAVLGGLMYIMGIPLTVLAAVIIFPEEKNIIRNKWVIIGSLAALGGTIGVAMSKGTMTHGYSIGVLYLAAFVVLYSLSYLLVKKMMVTIDPLSLGLLNCAFMCLLFLAGALAWGHLSRITELPWWPVAVLLFSGAFGLLIGNGLALIIIKRFGIIITRFAELAMPIVTGILGIIFLHETMNYMEILFALLILTGCFIILFKDKPMIGKIL